MTNADPVTSPLPLSALPDPIIIEYSIVPEDYVAFHTRHFVGSPKTRQVRIIEWLAFPLVLVLIAGLLLLVSPAPSAVFSASKRTTYAPVIIALFAVLWIIYYPLQYRRSLRKMSKRLLHVGKHEAFVGLRKLTLTPKALTVEASVFQWTFHWRAVERITEDEDYVFIYLSPESVNLVPKRDFKTPGEIRRFVDILRVFHAAADVDRKNILARNEKS